MKRFLYYLLGTAAMVPASLSAMPAEAVYDAAVRGDVKALRRSCEIFTAYDSDSLKALFQARSYNMAKNIDLLEKKSSQKAADVALCLATAAAQLGCDVPARLLTRKLREIVYAPFFEVAVTGSSIELRRMIRQKFYEDGVSSLKSLFVFCKRPGETLFDTVLATKNFSMAAVVYVWMYRVGIFPLMPAEDNEAFKGALLFEAVVQKQEKLLKTLILKGASFDVCDDSGVTPLKRLISFCFELDDQAAQLVVVSLIKQCKIKKKNILEALGEVVLDFDSYKHFWESADSFEQIKKRISAKQKKLRSLIAT